MEEKSKYEQGIAIVNDILGMAARLGVIHTVTEDVTMDGRHVRVNGEDLLFFGSCSYLGLGYDPRLKAAAMEAVDKYGVQFSTSRVYMSSRYYQEAEDLLRQMFGKPLLML